jgi:hypothetical protein
MVEIIPAVEGEDDWGDTVLTDQTPIEVPGRIGPDISVTGRSATTPDGLTTSRCRIRLPYGTVVPTSAVLRVEGVRWKVLNVKRARSPQLYSVYECQRLE